MTSLKVATYATSVKLMGLYASRVEMQLIPAVGLVM